MTEVHIKPEELKKLVMMGKKRTMFYGFNPGKKNPDLLLVDRKKTGEMLGRIVKKEGEGTKISFGTFNVDGRKLTVKTPQFIQGLAKLLRKHLKTIGLSFGVEVLDPSGAVLESDVSEDGNDGAEPAEAAAPIEENAEPVPGETVPADEVEAVQTAAQRNAITERVRALQAPVAALGEAGAPMKKAVAAVVGLIKEGSLDKAEAMLVRIEEAAAKAAAEQVATAEADENAAPEPQELLGRAGEVKKRLATLPDPIAEAVKKKLVQAIELVKAGDFAAAAAGLAAAERAIEVVDARAAEAATEDAKQAEAPVEEALDTQETEEVTAEAEDENQEITDEEVAAEAEPAQVDEPQVDPVAQSEWETIIEPLRAEVAAALDANLGDVTTINLAFAAALDQAEAGDFKAALKSAETLQNLLNEAADAPEAVAEVDGANTQAYEELRVKWEETRNALFADLERLKLAIQAKATAADGLAQIAENADVLHGYLEELDGSLDHALLALMRSKDTNEEERLKQEALASVNAYRSTLDSDFFQAVDQNGFTKTEIRGKALETLSGVENALAA